MANDSDQTGVTIPVFAHFIPLTDFSSGKPRALEDLEEGLDRAKLDILREARNANEKGLPHFGCGPGWMDVAVWTFHVISNDGGITVVYLPDGKVVT